MSDKFLSQEEIDKLKESISSQVEPVVSVKEQEPEPEPPVVELAQFEPLLVKGTKNGESLNLTLLMDLSLPISIELGRTHMQIKDILKLGIGSVIELDKLAGEPVDLLVNNKKFAEGEVVVIDENFGVRITNLVSTADKIKSLKPDSTK